MCMVFAVQVLGCRNLGFRAFFFWGVNQIRMCSLETITVKMECILFFL